jgi:hypothetical protein
MNDFFILGYERHKVCGELAGHGDEEIGAVLF